MRDSAMTMYPVTSMTVPMVPTHSLYVDRVLTIDRAVVDEYQIIPSIPDAISVKFPRIWFHWGFDVDRNQYYLAIETNYKEDFERCKAYFDTLFKGRQGAQAIGKIMAN